MKRSTKICQAMTMAESHLGLVFNDITLLEEAISHSSFANEAGSASNERLEFLGDSVISLFVTEALMDSFPQAAEGFLTKLRSKLICKDMNYKLAKRLKVETYLLVGAGQKRAKGPNVNVYADAFEAIVGAIYMDRGHVFTFRWLWSVYGTEFDKLDGASNKDVTDSKSQLSQLASKIQVSVRYEVMDQVGPDHAPMYDVACYLGSKMLAIGQGSSRKAAEQDAAGRALNTFDARLFTRSKYAD